MKRSRSIFVFILIAVIIGGAFLAKPSAGRTSTNNVVLPILNGASAGEPAELPAQVPPTATALSPTQPAVMLPETVVEGSEGFYASDLQTSGLDSESPEGAGEDEGWNPPPLEVPLAYHPWDHYWMIRPVGSNHNNFALAHYTFGSDGPANDLRIHHGVDLANPIGVEVYAAGDGTVVWAGKGSLQEDGYITAYGNSVVIEQDFGFNGEQIFTLYAHLSAKLVETGQHVESGQIIGLIGNTGQVSGPHVHFEVRIGHNRYNSVYNPLLWIAPYEGTGIIAGHAMFEDGTSAYDAAIAVIDRQTNEVIYRTTTYAGGGVRADANWNETFVVPDVPEGSYVVSAQHDGGRWSGEVTVVAGTTNWVEMVQNSTSRRGNDDPAESGSEGSSNGTTLP